MPVDPKSITAGKRYMTVTKHVRTVLAVTDDRVRFAYGGGESGGVPQWRWMDKIKFAGDAAKELPDTSAPDQQENSEGAKSKGAREPGARKTLTKRQ
jgi:hypothetical protein